MICSSLGVPSIAKSGGSAIRSYLENTKNPFFLRVEVERIDALGVYSYVASIRRMIGKFASPFETRGSCFRS